MARRGLGGSGDWSGAFANLYSFNKNEAKARQDAADQDAADKWANGLMTDDEWLAYIRTAIDREAGDPKSQQRWITALRKYSTVIADKDAEHEYEMGGSINALILHYQQRLTTMVKDSNEYRDVELHLNDLLDKRSGEKLTEAAETMVKDINLGKKTYGDLKRLLQEGLGEARDNSDLKKSIQNQIDQVNETMRVNALEGSFEKLQYEYDAGKISPGTYAKRLRSMAVQFKENDPKRYYQILEAAVALEKGGGRAGGGGGGGGSRGGGGGGGSSKKAINASIDSLQAKRNTAQALLEQFEAGATRGVDPSTGQLVAFNPGVIRELDETVVRSMDQLSAAYKAKGDLSAAANTQKSKAVFIATNVVAHNTFAVDEARRELMAATTKILDNALSNPDPTRGMGDVREAAKHWSDFSKSLTQKATKTKSFEGNRRIPGEESYTVYGGEKGLMDQVDGEFSAEAAAFSAALGTLATPGVDDASALAAVEALYGLGSGESNPWVGLASKALEVNGRQQGLASGDVVRIATPDGLVWAKTQEVSFTAPDPTGGNAVQVTNKVPTQYRDKSGKWVDIPVDGKTAKLVDVFIDINGTPTKVQAVATLSSPQGFDTWVAAKNTVINGVQLIAGKAVTDAQLARISGGKGGGRSLKDLRDAGVLTSGPAFPAWSVTTPGYTDSHGQTHKPQTWSQDPGTGMWYLGSLPIRGAQRDENGMVRYGEDGPLIDWKAYGSAAGVPAPYAGDDPKAMQDRLNNGEVDTSALRGRDLLGQPTDEPLGLDYSYYNPIIDTAQNALDVVGDVVESFTGWWDQAKREKRSSDLKLAVFKDNKDDSGVYRPSQGAYGDSAGGEDFFAGIAKGLGEALGLNLTGTKARPSFGGPSIEERDDKWAKLGDAVAQKAKSEAPLIKLPDGGKRASGPDLKAKVGDLNIKPTGPSVPVIKPPAPKPPAPKPKPTAPPAVFKDNKDDSGVYRPPAPAPKPSGAGTGKKAV